MKDKTILKISAIVLMIVWLFGVGYLVYLGATEGDKVIKCYDHNDNEIIGQECIQLGSDYYIGACFLFFIGIFGFMVYFIVDSWDVN